MPDDYTADEIVLGIYASFRISLNTDLLKYKRKNDSLLDWLGDWGGLLDSFHLVAELIVEAF